MKRKGVEKRCREEVKEEVKRVDPRGVKGMRCQGVGGEERNDRNNRRRRGDGRESRRERRISVIMFSL